MSISKIFKPKWQGLRKAEQQDLQTHHAQIKLLRARFPEHISIPSLDPAPNNISELRYEVDLLHESLNQLEIAKQIIVPCNTQHIELDASQAAIKTFKCQIVEPTIHINSDLGSNQELGQIASLIHAETNLGILGLKPEYLCILGGFILAGLLIVILIENERDDMSMDIRKLQEKCLEDRKL